MISRSLKIYGNEKKGKGGKASETSASAATPENIDEIGKPAIHLISGSTGVGKSNVARNMVESYWEAHSKARTKPHPEILVFTGAGGDPVWSGSNKDIVKMFSPQSVGDFVDEVNRRYDRAMRAKKSNDNGTKAPEGDMSPLVHEGGDDADSKHKPSMVVIDDAGSSELLPQQMFRSPIAQAMQSHRHADMTFIVSSQRYHSHSPWLRANARTVTAFPPRGAEEQGFMVRDLPIDKEALRRGFQTAKANGVHNFVHIDTKERVATHNFTGHPI